MDGLTALRRLPAGLTARRAWPHRDGLAVEARTSGGTVVAMVLRADGVRLLRAADPALPALAPALARPGSTLLSHRPGRRAMVREPDGHFLKVLRPGRAGPVADGLRHAAGLLAGRRGAPQVPRVCAVDDLSGWVRLDAMPGTLLHTLLGQDPHAAVEACTRAGEAITVFQACAAAGLPRHTAAAEVAVLLHWLEDADGWAGTGLAAYAPAVVERLASLPEPVPVPCHRDLHDKQILAARTGGIGLLDLDTLCAADPALDPANLLAQLRLRALQGICSPAAAARCAGVLQARCAGPGAVEPAALAAYTASALLRLAAVYTFRPGPAGLAAQLAAAATSPDPATWRDL